jgi:hypothetical protein
MRNEMRKVEMKEINESNPYLPVTGSVSFRPSSSLVLARNSQKLSAMQRQLNCSERKSLSACLRNRVSEASNA